jgi:DNA-directed RNA polymerase
VEVVSRKTHRKGRKRDRLKGELYLAPTAATLEWVRTRNEAMEFLTPVTLPMVVPPLPWAQGVRGGYRYALRNRYPFVRGASSAMLKVHNEQCMPVVYEAVNAIQETAWTVNDAVLELVHMIRSRGIAIAGLPAYDSEPMPAKPLDIGSNEEARKKWRKAARIVHETNHAREIKALEVEKTLLAVRAVKDEPAIYFPCSVDFRGRVYPMTTYLNPQGDDLSKALLMFAEKKPLGPDGAYWLAIHGANSLDETPDGLKVKMMTMQERARGYSRTPSASSRLHAIPSGTCGGLMLTSRSSSTRSAWSGMASSRLTSKERAMSMSVACRSRRMVAAMGYNISALCFAILSGVLLLIWLHLTVLMMCIRLLQTVVCHSVRADSAAGDWFARQWLASGFLKRKLVKRPTMTYGYGSKLFGMRAQTEEYLSTDHPEAKRIFTDAAGMNLLGDAALYIARHIWDSLQGTVVAAAQGMKWMQDCARTRRHSSQQARRVDGPRHRLQSAAGVLRVHPQADQDGAGRSGDRALRVREDAAGAPPQASQRCRSELRALARCRVSDVDRGGSEARRAHELRHDPRLIRYRPRRLGHAGALHPRSVRRLLREP